MGLGQILEKGTAQDAPLLLATTAVSADQDTATGLIGSSGLFLASLTSVRFACSLGPGTAAGILLGLLPHRSGAQQPARPKKC